MADSIFRVPKLKGSSNYDIWALRLESILIKEDCTEIMQIDPINLSLSNYTAEELQRLKYLESKALSIIRLALEDGPLLQTKELKSLFAL
jgi:hypothetical protein